MKKIRIIGGGLAGPEAALQAASLGCQVELYEMRPSRSTEAHQTADFAELVCSNSLKSESENTAPWLLKQEMRRAGSILLAEADASAVPAGHALAVDRVEFSRRVAARIASEHGIAIHREEVTALDPGDPDTLTILATGPLTSPALAAELQRLTGSNHLAFYDSISPIVDAATIDMDRVFLAARYDKGTADYINCPFTKEEYDRFLDALTTAESVPVKPWEQLPGHESSGAPSMTALSSWVGSTNSEPAIETLHYFEGCLPIEETARRGRDTLRFGPMKPVGLTNPRTGRWPYAVVQLRQENLRADSYNLVGFQNHLKFGEQAARPAPHPRPRECHLPALRPDPPQHLHRRALVAHRNPPAPRPYLGPHRRAAQRSRGLHRIHRFRFARRALRRSPRPWHPAHPRPARLRQRQPHPLHHPRGK